MAFNIIEEIRKKSREEWQGELKEKCADLRIWLQENGELGFVLGLCSGLFIVCFFKLFVGLLAVLVIAAFTIYLTAYEEGERELSQVNRSLSVNGHGNGGAAIDSKPVVEEVPLQKEEASAEAPKKEKATSKKKKSSSKRSTAKREQTSPTKD